MQTLVTHWQRWPTSRSHPINVGFDTSRRVPCPPGTSTTSSGGAVAKSTVGQHAQTLGAADRPRLLRDRDDAVVGEELLRRRAEDLPGAGEVEFLDVVEEQDPDRDRHQRSPRCGRS